jgi:hypothetical protein
MVKLLPSGPNTLSARAEHVVVNSAVLPRKLLKSRGECPFLVFPECGEIFIHFLFYTATQQSQLFQTLVVLTTFLPLLQMFSKHSCPEFVL